MKEHIQVKKTYACSYCDKKFEGNQNIKMHERIHTSKKPFECLYCDKTFARKNIMKKHERTHTDEKTLYMFAMHFGDI